MILSKENTLTKKTVQSISAARHKQIQYKVAILKQVHARDFEPYTQQICS